MERARDRRRRAQKLLHKAKAEAAISEMMDNVDIVSEAEKWQSNEERAKRFLAEELGASGSKAQKPIEPRHLKAAEDACHMGDEAFSKRDFDAALKYYLRAKQLNPREITYLNNMAAVKLEQKKYHQCMDVCDEAVNIGKKDPNNLKKIEKVLDLRAIANKFFVDQMEKQVRMANKEDDKSPSEESKEFRLLLKLNGLDDKLERVSESARDYMERKAESKLLKAEENALSTAAKLPKVFGSPAEFNDAIMRYLKAHDLSPLHPTILLDVAKALSEKKNFKGCATLILYTFDQLPEWTDERLRNEDMYFTNITVI